MLRKKSGLNQEQCALQLNLPRTTLQNYETKKTEPDATRLISIAQFFNISVEKLLLENLQNDNLNDFRFTSKKRENDNLIDNPNDNLNSDFSPFSANKRGNSEAINHLKEIIQLLHQNIASLNKIIEGKDEVIEGKNTIIAQLSAKNELLKKERTSQRGAEIPSAKKINAV